MTPPTDPRTPIQMLKDAMLTFARERDWLQFHKPKNLAMGMAIEAAELMEHFQWCSLEESEKLMQDPVRRQAAGEELADVLLYVVQFANVCGMDLTQTALDKLEKNARKYPADQFRGDSRKYSDQKNPAR